MTRIARNTGKSLEAQVQRAGEWYRAQGLAWLERVEPPQRWVNGKPVIVRPSLADYLGCYYVGNSIRIPVAVECKAIGGVKRGLSVKGLIKRKDQRDRLRSASFIWQVRVVFEADFGRGTRVYSTPITPANFSNNTIFDADTITPCRYLPNGAPDILGLLS